MAQFNNILTEEDLRGLFTDDGRNRPFAKLLETIFDLTHLIQSRE